MPEPATGIIPKTEENKRIRCLMTRLWNICNGIEFKGELWHRGLSVIERKFDVILYLSSFEPQGIVLGEKPASEITITVLPEV